MSRMFFEIRLSNQPNQLHQRLARCEFLRSNAGYEKRLVLVLLELFSSTHKKRANKWTTRCAWERPDMAEFPLHTQQPPGQNAQQLKIRVIPNLPPILLTPFSIEARSWPSLSCQVAPRNRLDGGMDELDGSQGSGNWTATRAGLHEAESDLQPQMTNEVR